MTRAEAIKRLETCVDCGDCLTCKDHDEAIEVVVAALKEQGNCCKNGNSSWISVEERLPEVNKLVLCYRYNASHYRIGFYIGAKYTEDVAAFRNINEPFAFGVTHWMPLPEPPKEATE